MVEDYKEHINFILVENDLYVSKWLKRSAWNSTTLDGEDLRIAVITDDESYCSALHEFGHIIEKSSDELKAWKWAKKNAFIWTDEMQKVAEGCLSEYEKSLGISYGPL